MGRPRKKNEAENLIYRQVEEYVSLAAKRIPGLKSLEITVDDKGKTKFTYVVQQTHSDSGSV